MTNTTHPAQPVAEFAGYDVDGQPTVTWLDRDNMPRVGTKLFTQAAANKAAEEGGLPALPEPVTRGFESFTEKAGYFEHFDTEQMQDYARAAIEADRASRQVANKAEVDLILQARSPEGDPWQEVSGEDFFKAHANGYEVSICVNAPGKNSIRLEATPPATTGASPAPRPTDDDLWDATIRDRDAYHEWADNLAYAIAVHFDVDIGEHSNQNLPWAEALEVIENAERVGASTVLKDEFENCPNCYADRPDNTGCADCGGTGLVVSPDHGDKNA